MAETIKDFFGGEQPQFSAEPWYNPSGDSIHYHMTPEEFYGDRVDDKLTLYRSRETNDVVGCQIKGVSAILKKFGDFDLFLRHDDGVALAQFVFVSHVTAENSRYAQEERRQLYLYILERLGKAKVTLPEDAAAAQSVE